VKAIQLNECLADLRIISIISCRKTMGQGECNDVHKCSELGSYLCDKHGWERESYLRRLDRAFFDSDLSHRSSFSGPAYTYVRTRVSNKFPCLLDMCCILVVSYDVTWDRLPCWDVLLTYVKCDDNFNSRVS
jgi:hypothetical protein